MSVSADQVRDEIFDSIQNDPTIKDASHVTVIVKKQGIGPFAKKEVHLVGRIDNDKDKMKISELINDHAHGVPVIDELRVKSS